MKFFSPKVVLPKLIFEKKYCKIFYHVDINTVHLEWHGESTLEEFTEACDFSLKVLVEKKADKMIADNSKATAVPDTHQVWLTENWFPRAIEKGFQYSAVISSNNDVVRSALQLIVSRVNTKHVIVKYFYNSSDAKEWLKKHN